LSQILTDKNKIMNKQLDSKEAEAKPELYTLLGNVLPDEDEECDLEDCPNCNSDAVGYDGTGSVPFLECFQCDHNWIP
jgi:hypothetical protein